MSDSEDENQEIKATRAPPKHFGTEQEHEGWTTQFYAWAVGQGWEDTLFGPINENDYPQRDARVTLGANDPRGPEGTVLEAETDNSRIEVFNEENKQAWAATMPMMKKEALRVAMRAKKSDARDLLRVLNLQFGMKSTPQVVDMLIEFFNQCSNGKRDKDLATYINDFQDTARQLDDNNAFDKETILIVLFLIGLGPQYRMFANLAKMFKGTDWDLENVIAQARDFKTGHDDEADNSGLALSAQCNSNNNEAPPRNSRGHYMDQWCTNTHCNNKQGHTIQDCFAHGGGKAHYTKAQRKEWLDRRNPNRRMPWEKPREERMRPFRGTARRGRSRSRSRSRDNRRRRSRSRSRSRRRESTNSRTQADAATERKQKKRMKKKMKKKLQKQVKRKAAKGGYMVDFSDSDSDSDSDSE